MDSFELNKIIGAVLGTLLFVMGAGFLAEAIYEPIEGRGPGYALPEPEGTDVAEAETPAEAVIPLGTLLASADAAAGEKAATKCKSCHNFDESNKSAPGLYDVVERVIGSHPGWAYSDGMAAKGAAGETWTYDNLNTFLTAPKAFVPGTKMNFAGVKSPEERANILAFLATLSANPKPFPAPEAAPAGEGTPTTTTNGADEPMPADMPNTETPAAPATN